jgi:hypothetical protein
MPVPTCPSAYQRMPQPWATHHQKRLSLRPARPAEPRAHPLAASAKPVLNENAPIVGQDCCCDCLSIVVQSGN